MLPLKKGWYSPNLLKILKHQQLKFINVWLSSKFWVEHRVWRVPNSTIMSCVLNTVGLGDRSESSAHVAVLAKGWQWEGHWGAVRVVWPMPCNQILLPCHLGPECKKPAQKAAPIDLFPTVNSLFYPRSCLLCVYTFQPMREMRVIS